MAVRATVDNIEGNYTVLPAIV